MKPLYYIFGLAVIALGLWYTTAIPNPTSHFEPVDSVIFHIYSSSSVWKSSQSSLLSVSSRYYSVSTLSSDSSPSSLWTFVRPKKGSTSSSEWSQVSVAASASPSSSSSVSLLPLRIKIICQNPTSPRQKAFCIKYNH